MNMTRRTFLQSAAVFSAMGFAPRFLGQAAAALPVITGFNDDKVLVVVQLGGGNDGLNTVVPFGQDAYYRARPKIGLRDNDLIKLNDGLALNAHLKPLMRLYDNAELAIVQGVGYPNPDRSHFRSMEIWHTASDADTFYGHGWIGRYFDNTCGGSARPQAGLAIDNERPQAFDCECGVGVATDNPSSFGWQPGPTADTESAFASINAPVPSGNPALDFLRHTTQNAVQSSAEVQSAAATGGVKQLAAQPARSKQLDLVAGLIRGGLATRVYYVSIGGFDTHAGQVDRHGRLLSGVASALSDFQAQLERDGTADRVLTMVFSEFGRRVEENASGGTDHGTAAPMFLLGKHVNAGLHGAYPSLETLDRGDLIHTVDFRRVYASVLQGWFKADAAPILHGQFDPLPLIV
jgi:uncharacterized protein (DUF1501 family)